MDLHSAKTFSCLCRVGANSPAKPLCMEQARGIKTRLFCFFLFENNHYENFSIIFLKGITEKIIFGKSLKFTMF